MLPPPAEKPCPAVISVLQAMLDKAKAGELNGLAMVMAFPGSGFGSVFVLNPAQDAATFLGMLDVLKARILAGVAIPEGR